MFRHLPEKKAACQACSIRVEEVVNARKLNVEELWR